MAMDAKTENVHMPEEEVSQDQESFENVKLDDIKVNEELKMEDPTKPEEKESNESFTIHVNGGEDYSKICALPDLGKHEKKALGEFRLKLEDAILTNALFEGYKNDDKQDKEEKPKMETLEKSNPTGQNIQEVKFNKDVTLWGVPLLPSKGDERTDVMLEKFLRGRDYKVDEAYEMIKNTLRWRKENKIDSILEEDFGSDYDSVAYISGDGLEGHPVCYNVYGVFGDDKQYNKILGTEESRHRFLRWRLQMMEKQIQKLNFKPGEVSSLIQINDLHNTPGPARKDLRNAMKEAVGTLQNNYPEFVSRNIFINVPFWYYAFNALLSPFLAPRTKSKFLFIRPAKVTETLLKYISAAEIPVHYGGLKRENDLKFSNKDVSSEVIVKGGSNEVIEVPAPEEGSDIIWDVTVLGWEVNYKEEFIPHDEGANPVIINKERRMGSQEESVRNSFKNDKPGKVVLTIQNASFQKKRVLYRHKTIKAST